MSNQPAPTPDPNPNARADDTGLPDKSGWDDAPRTKDVPWHEPMGAPPRKRLPPAVVYTAMVALVLFLLLASVLVIGANSGRQYATNETAAVQNIMALETAQMQYLKKYDCFADSAWRLYQGGYLIAPDLRDAFEDWQSNGDKRNPVPKAGYIYRMLQGDTVNGITGFRRKPNDPNSGMLTWGVTCRTAQPGVTGENQYYGSEAGTTYKFPEPLSGTPHYKQFLLDKLPAPGQVTWNTAK